MTRRELYRLLAAGFWCQRTRGLPNYRHNDRDMTADEAEIEGFDRRVCKLFATFRSRLSH